MRPILYEDENGAWDADDIKSLIQENQRLIELVNEAANELDRGYNIELTGNYFRGKLRAIAQNKE